MATAPELTRIRDQAAGFPTDPYLLTVDERQRPHCSPTEVSWCDEAIVVSAPSRWASIEACGHHHVSLLWPPAKPGGYSLIVDGVAEQESGDPGDRLSITPTRAVLHRSGVALGDPSSSCGSDCVPIFPS